MTIFHCLFTQSPCLRMHPVHPSSAPTMVLCPPIPPACSVVLLVPDSSTCAPGLPRHYCGAISPNAVLQLYAPVPLHAPLFTHTISEATLFPCTFEVCSTCLRFHVAWRDQTERATVSSAVFCFTLSGNSHQHVHPHANASSQSFLHCPVFPPPSLMTNWPKSGAY